MNSVQNMGASKNQYAEQIANAYDVKAVYVSDHGAGLMEREQEVVDSFMSIANMLTHEGSANTDLHKIDSGQSGAVYEFPDNPALCIKAVNPRTMVSFQFPDIYPHQVSDVITEARFMNAIERKLSSRKSSVMAPRQYAAVAFAGGAALLQERIPEDYASVRRLIREYKVNKQGAVDYRAQQAVIIDRLSKAVGRTVLSLGIGDLVKGKQAYNSGNVLVERGKPVGEDSPMYVIDLIGCGRVRNRLARTAAAIAIG